MSRRYKRFDHARFKGRSCFVTKDQAKGRPDVTVSCLRFKTGGRIHETTTVVQAKDLELVTPSHKVKDLLDITARHARAINR